MTFAEIRSLAKAGVEITIEVHSVDPSLYQIFQRFGEHLEPITERGRSAVFTSRTAALSALAELGLDEVHFVHRSAYGEMIGTETPFDRTELRQRVGISHLRD